MRKSFTAAVLVSAMLVGSSLFTGSWAATIKNGFNIPITGGISQVGASSQPVAEMLKDEVNAAGGLQVGDKTYQLEFIYENNESNADSAAATGASGVTRGLVDRYQTMYSNAPDGVAAFTWDPARMLFPAIQRAKELSDNLEVDRDAVRDQLAQIRALEGITGKVTSFTPHCDPIKYAATVKISDNGEPEFYKWVCPRASSRLRPPDFEYLGAFKLPGGSVRPRTFAYGGNAMTFNPNGDPTGPSDGFPGSLFISGHDRLPYGELRNGGQVAEVSIPLPVLSRRLRNLNQSAFVQSFHNVLRGYFRRMEEIPRMGMLYLDARATGPKIHVGWGQHIEPDPTAATHAWFDPNLDAPDVQGPWFIGHQAFYSVNDYMMEIPARWAKSHAKGRPIGTGRFKDGGWSGMGPELFAYRPWTDNEGSPAPPRRHLRETVLLQYESSVNTDAIERCLNGYQHPDEWAGGAWITTSTGKKAVLFVGTKSTGSKYWYGYVNSAGPDQPCVDDDVVGQFEVCRMADGSPCPPEDYVECPEPISMRGWWTTRFNAQFILYDPDDLASVADGESPSWSPQPYAVMEIDRHLYLNPSGIEPEMLGSGVQRRYRIGSVAYDRGNDLLYVLELFAQGAKPVVHVWRVR